MAVTVREINSYAEIDGIRSAWLELRQAAGNAYICTHPDWVRATQFVPNTGTPTLLTAWDGDRLIGLAPTRIRPYRYRGIPLRKIEFISHSPVNDFLTRERREEVVRAFLQRLCGGARERSWDFLELARVGNEASRLEPIREALRGLGLRPYEIEDHPHGVCVTDDWKSYVRRRGGSFTKELRHRENRLARLGNVSVMRYSGFEDRWEDPESSEKLERILQAAIECARNSWQAHAEEGTRISDPDLYRFFREVIYSFASTNQLLFHVLLSGDVPISFDLSFLDGRYLTDYKTGYHPKYRYYGPGAHIIKTTIEYACLHDIKHVDLMSIETRQDFKRRLVDEIHRTRRVTAFNRTVNGSLARLVMKGLAPAAKRLAGRRGRPLSLFAFRGRCLIR